MGRKAQKRRLGELGAAILNRMIGAGMTEKVTFDKNLQWKRVSHSSIWGQSLLDRGSDRCKCPEAEWLVGDTVRRVVSLGHRKQSGVGGVMGVEKWWELGSHRTRGPV